MICAKLLISSLDCKASLQGLLPVLTKKKGDPDSYQPLYRFLGRLGGSAESILPELLDAVPSSALEELLLGVVAAYEDPLVRQINSALAAHEIAKSFSAERLLMERDTTTGSYHLMLGGININYGTLLDNEIVMKKAESLIDGIFDRYSDSTAGQLFSLVARKALQKTANVGKIANWLIHNPMDRRCVQLLEMETVKKPLLQQAERALHQTGVCVTLEDAVFSFDQAAQPETHLPENRGIFDSAWLSLESKRAAVDAFVTYIEKHLKEAQ